MYYTDIFNSFSESTLSELFKSKNKNHLQIYIHEINKSFTKNLLIADLLQININGMFSYISDEIKLRDMPPKPGQKLDFLFFHISVV